MFKFTCIATGILFFVLNASGQAIVTGRITGFDDKPLKLASVFLSKPNVKYPLKYAEVNKDGQYKIAIDSKGVWLLRFTGAYYQEYLVAVYVDTPRIINVDVRLANYALPKGKELSTVKVFGNFNDWYLPQAVPMEKQTDGTFATTIKTDKNPIIYQLTGVVQEDIPGTDADSVIYDKYHGYNAVLKVENDSVRITFDPRKLFFSKDEPQCIFSRSDSEESMFSNVYRETLLWLSEYNEAYMKSMVNLSRGGKPNSFDFESVFTTIKKQLAEEKNLIVRQELELVNFMFLQRKKVIDTENSRHLLATIPPSSFVWSLAPALISVAFDNSGYDKTLEDEYVRQVIDENPDSVAISLLLQAEFMKRLYGKGKDEAMRYYDIAVNQFGNMPGGKEVAQYHNISSVDVGKIAPAFHFASIDSKKIFTNKSFKHKYYLLYFWATWSKPAVNEIRNLRDAFREFKRNGLEILGISLDSSEQAVENFERTKGKIPWLNGIVRNGFNDKACVAYEVYSLPKLILVAPNGKIVAVGLDLRGKKIIETLSKYLVKNK
jgi:peroxiredoxin